jgi:hypothetical protein
LTIKPIVEATNPQQAAQVLNTLVNLYIEKHGHVQSARPLHLRPPTEEHGGYFAELEDGVSEYAGETASARFGKRVKRYDCRSGGMNSVNYF